MNGETVGPAGPGTPHAPPGAKIPSATLLSLLVLLGLVPLWAFFARILSSDYLALAVATPDDSFYYLLPAWRFLRHGFFTFDGIHATYGFQPLFMVLLTGLSALFPSIEGVFRAGLGANAMLHVATGVVVGLVVNTLLSACSTIIRYIASLMAATFYFLGWNLFWINLTLKENSLAAFLYVLAIFILVRALTGGPERSIKSDVLLGVLIGLLILTRLLPATLLAAGVMIGMAWVCLPRRSGLTISAAMLVPLLMWGIYALAAFGHLMPSSMTIKAGGAGVLSALGHWWSAGLGAMYDWVGWYVTWVFSLFTDRYVTPARFLIRVGFLAAGMGALAVSVVFASWWSRSRASIVLLAAASFAGLLATPALGYMSTRNLLTYSTWYLFDVSAILAIVCATALGFLGQRVIARSTRPGANPGTAFVSAAIAIVWIVAVVAEIDAYRNVPIAKWEESGCAGQQRPCVAVADSSWEKTVANAALWFRSEVTLEDGERVGAFNAGLVGLLLLPGALVNLDGLANDDIRGDYLGRVGAWPSPTLAEYISRERIRYVIDHIPPWPEWETVVGLETELVMQTERGSPLAPPSDPLPYYVVRFVNPFPAAASPAESDIEKGEDVGSAAAMRTADIQ